MSERIKARREQLGLSRAECADRAGMKRENWARLEAPGGRADRATWSVDTARRVTAALDWSLSTLLRL